MQDRIYLTDLQVDSEVAISCKLNDKTAEFKGTITKVSDTFICLSVPMVDGKTLTFEGVNTSIMATVEGIPYKFPECLIAFYKGIYVAKSVKAGTKVNRRGSFRIGVSVMASLLRSTAEPTNVYVRDISATGYSITTDKVLSVGEEICVRFDDLGMRLQLVGRIVRMEETEDKKIYGVQMIKPPAILENYINGKQRDILRKKRGR